MNIPTKIPMPLRKKSFYACDHIKEQNKDRKQRTVTSNVNFAKQVSGVPIVKFVLHEGRA